MQRRWLPWVLVLASAAITPGAAAAPPAPLGASTLVDDFENLDGWSAHPADGVDLTLHSDKGFRGRALRLDFRFLGGGGYAVARKTFAVDLPENYAFSFRVRGDAPPNHLEFKLIDGTGENVWWSVRRDVEFPAAWETFVIKKRHLSFAWGPIGGGEIREVAAIEFAVTAGSGGTGSVWIDELELKTLLPSIATPPRPVASASSARPGQGAEMAIDGDSASSWTSDPDDIHPWFALDLVETREYGGLIVDWVPERYAIDYVVEDSDDGIAWELRRAVEGGNGGRDYLLLPESESRFLRVRTLERGGAGGLGMAELAVQPLEWSVSREAFFQAIAGDAPRGSFPRGISGEQSYWTVAGVDGDARESLLSEDGMVETGKSAFSVEPFLFADGRLATWSNAHIEQSLDQGFLPIPSVKWQVGELSLTITAFGIGPPGASSIVVRYRLRTSRLGRTPAILYLALRPFQVNPPSQTLNAPGGTAPIREIALADRTIHVNGDRAVVSLTRPSGFGAATFDEGDIVVDHLSRGRLPPRTRVEDSFAAASGALAFSLDLTSGSEQEVDLLIPLYSDSPLPPDQDDAAALAWVGKELEHCRSGWEAHAERVVIELPESASQVEQSLKRQLGIILINRAGPALQPGTRSYARSWIRDGALTSSALLRLGHPEPVRSFIEWYAPYQYPSGKVPCAVDARGADPVPEHDSSGEFIFLIAEFYRYTGDRALLTRMWPRVLGAVAYLDSLRHERRTAEFLTPEKRVFYGILPPSISHEGYSAKPMHSYWDDFFALRGFKDAAFLAGELGFEDEQTRLSAIRNEFQHDLAASVETAMRQHRIDFVPGSADLGDFDPTSTTIALSPVAANISPAAIERTFEAYYEFFRGRREGASWEAFTPYEIRNIGAFVRLGWRERARELLNFFLSYQQPLGWRQWAEVVWRESRVPHFIGDMPHSWVGSDFVRSVLDMFLYEREDQDALVIGAGIPLDWLEPAPGVVVRDLRTPYGPLSYTMALRGEEVRVRIEGALEIPSGGIVVRTPIERPIRQATVNGRPANPNAQGELVVRRLPATVLLRP